VFSADNLVSALKQSKSKIICPAIDEALLAMWAKKMTS